ncbi:hypothetical protein ACJX0J_020425, partial [Zea mays]
MGIPCPLYEITLCILCLLRRRLVDGGVALRLWEVVEFYGWMFCTKLFGDRVSLFGMIIGVFRVIDGIVLVSKSFWN